jgi:hypothetical protein
MWESENIIKCGLTYNHIIDESYTLVADVIIK